MPKKTILVFCFFMLICFSLSSQETMTSHSLWLQASTLIEAKMGYTFNYKFPFMQGESPLTSGNNINVALTAEASPISLSAAASATWTPIAFLEFSAGGRIGTGWPIKLFGDTIDGQGLTRADTNNDREVYNLGGVSGKLHAAAAFQFDLAAIFPGEWNHVVFKTYHEINYLGNSNAAGTDSWFFESSDKEYINGFTYYTNCLIGYQMPIFLSMIAFMMEAELTLYDIPNQSVWGGDLARWTLSPALFFNFHKQLEIITAIQFRSQRNFIEADWKDKYDRTLTVNSSNPQRIEFHRVAIIATYRF